MYIIRTNEGPGFNNPIEEFPIIGEGKTKALRRFGLKANRILLVEHKPDITAFDDPAFTGRAENKGVVDTYVTSAFDQLLEKQGVPTAHRTVYNARTTMEDELQMMPFEIIWRRVNVTGNSWEKRHPKKVPEGASYDEVIYEACLKWSVMDTDGQIIHDPFLILDKHNKPLLRADGMPRLMHPKIPGKELEYTSVVNPHGRSAIDPELVRSEVADFAQNSGAILYYTKQIQQTAASTFAAMGEVHCDGKVEFGKGMTGYLGGQVVKGDSLDFDSVRNVAPKKILVNGKEYEFTEPTRGRDMRELFSQPVRIVEAHHSTKQAYRDLVATKKDAPVDEARQQYNDEAARLVVDRYYIPGALALSNLVGKDVNYILEKVYPAFVAPGRQNT